MKDYPPIQTPGSFNLEKIQKDDRRSRRCRKGSHRLQPPPTSGGGLQCACAVAPIIPASRIHTGFRDVRTMCAMVVKVDLLGAPNLAVKIQNYPWIRRWGPPFDKLW
jgi:hypothetical protein